MYTLFSKNYSYQMGKNNGNVTKFRVGDGAGVTSTESWTVGGAGGLGTVGAGAGA